MIKQNSSAAKNSIIFSINFSAESFEKFLSSIEDSEKSEFYLPAAVDEWIKEEKARVLVRSASCTWIGVTYQEDKPRVIESVAQLVTSGTYPSPLL